MSTGRMGFFCNSFRTLGSVDVAVRRGSIITFVNPSNYNGSAFLHLFGHVGSLVPNSHLRKRVLVSKEGVCSGSIRISRLHGDMKVIFRHPGPFPGDVFRGITCKLQMGKIGSGRFVHREIRRALGKTTL